MSEKFKQRFGILVKSVMPAAAVMVTGLIATYIIYGNHPRAQAEGAQFSASEVGNFSGVEPAAGTPAAAPAEEKKAAPAETPPATDTGTTIMKDEGEDSGETGASTDNTMASGASPPAPDAGTTGGEPAPAPPTPAQ